MPTTPSDTSGKRALNQGMEASYLLPLMEVGFKDADRVGQKMATLGELRRELLGRIMIPDGFVVTTDAYRDFLGLASLDERIRNLCKNLNPNNLELVRQRGSEIRHACMTAKFPALLEDTIVSAYDRLSHRGGLPAAVAVRSSPATNGLDFVFPGQHETYLNVSGAASVLYACKSCFASMFTDRAIAFRLAEGLDLMRLGMAIGIQQMVRSDLAVSGTITTADPISGFTDLLLITASYGLGEPVTHGLVHADHYLVFRPTLVTGHKSLLQKVLGHKEFKLVYDSGGSQRVKIRPNSQEQVHRFALEEEDILKLAQVAVQIEAQLKKQINQSVPLYLEWAKDGKTGALAILHVRPENLPVSQQCDILEDYELKDYGSVLLSGRSVSRKIASGPVRVVRELSDLNEIKEGDVLVADYTDPEWEPVMKKAAAIITCRCMGRACHSLRLSRELGIPAILGTHNATEVLTNGQWVTVSCAEGEVGYVFEGRLQYEIKRLNVKNLPRPKTRILMDVSSSEEALRWSFIPNDGVGLARLEFIIVNQIRIHPLALLEFEELENAGVKAEIQQLTAGYADKGQFYVDKLAGNIAMIAAAFYPKDVIVRLTDLKSNEYAGLIGGQKYEPVDKNPLVGFRGASRYYHPRYQAGFALECQALKKVRDEMGLRNLKILVPFCRTIAEACRVQAELEKHGLKRGRDHLELFLLCELPSNVMLADEFTDLFDGFMIGLDDLTQLTLGVDRNSEVVSSVFDERNPAVRKTITHLIHSVRAKGLKIGVCGQAVADYPELTEFLVEQGIDSISLKPDSVLKTTLAVLEKEKALAH